MKYLKTGFIVVGLTFGLLNGLSAAEPSSEVFYYFDPEEGQDNPSQSQSSEDDDSSRPAGAFYRMSGGKECILHARTDGLNLESSLFLNAYGGRLRLADREDSKQFAQVKDENKKLNLIKLKAVANAKAASFADQAIQTLEHYCK